MSCRSNRLQTVRLSLQLPPSSKSYCDISLTILIWCVDLHHSCLDDLSTSFGVQHLSISMQPAGLLRLLCWDWLLLLWWQLPRLLSATVGLLRGLQGLLVPWRLHSLVSGRPLH